MTAFDCFASQIRGARPSIHLHNHYETAAIAEGTLFLANCAAGGTVYWRKCLRHHGLKRLFHDKLATHHANSQILLHSSTSAVPLILIVPCVHPHATTACLSFESTGVRHSIKAGCRAIVFSALTMAGSLQQMAPARKSHSQLIRASFAP